jgi:two-component system response regulator AtoC
VREIPDSVWRALRCYAWPGKVRELRNVVERCVLFSEGDAFPERWLQLPGVAFGADATASGPSGESVALPLDGSVSLDEMERRVIQAVLERTDHNTAAAARLLGTTRQTLRYRIQKHGLGSGAAED